MKAIWPLVIAAVLAAQTTAFARDCGRAQTDVDRAICRDRDLSHLDDEMAALYREVGRSAAAEPVKTAFLRQQRDWLAHRDAACRTADPGCLTGQYRERRDQLTALAATATAAGGRLDSVAPVILRGSWKSQAVLDPERSAAAKPADLNHSLDLADLPQPGETVTTGPGKLCIADQPCETVGWSATTVGALSGGDHVARDLGLPPQSRAYTGGTGSPRSSLTLVPRGSRDIVAVFGLCGPNATDCRTAYQPWLPADAGSRIE